MEKWKNKLTIRCGNLDGIETCGRSLWPAHKFNLMMKKKHCEIYPVWNLNLIEKSN